MGTLQYRRPVQARRGGRRATACTMSRGRSHAQHPMQLLGNCRMCGVSRRILPDGLAHEPVLLIARHPLLVQIALTDLHQPAVHLRQCRRYVLGKLQDCRILEDIAGGGHGIGGRQQPLEARVAPADRRRIGIGAQKQGGGQHICGLGSPAVVHGQSGAGGSLKHTVTGCNSAIKSLGERQQAAIPAWLALI